MNNYIISINQLASFSNSTENAKNRIIAQQLSPDPFRISWYQLSKARIKKSLELKGDLQPILDGINILRERKPSKARQKTNNKVSIEAMERFITMKLPQILDSTDYLIIKPKNKVVQVEGVNVIISPDLVLKGTLNGKTVYGAIKIHISKSKPFELKQSQIVAHLIYKYLKKEVAENSSEVLPELCLAIDIFGDRIVSAVYSNEEIAKRVKDLCIEVKEIWNAA